MTIKYYKKNVYGNEKLYIADATQRKAVEAITQRKTIDSKAMQGLETLGFTFQEVLESEKN